jgi:hypothetical protein
MNKLNTSTNKPQNRMEDTNIIIIWFYRNFRISIKKCHFPNLIINSICDNIRFLKHWLWHEEFLQALIYSTYFSKFKNKYNKIWTIFIYFFQLSPFSFIIALRFFSMLKIKYNFYSSSKIKRVIFSLELLKPNFSIWI